MSLTQALIVRNGELAYGGGGPELTCRFERFGQRG